VYPDCQNLKSPAKRSISQILAQSRKIKAALPPKLPTITLDSLTTPSIHAT